MFASFRKHYQHLFRKMTLELKRLIVGVIKLVACAGFAWFVATFLIIVTCCRIIRKTYRLFFKPKASQLLLETAKRKRKHINPFKNVNPQIYMKQPDVICKEGYEIRYYEFETPDGAYVSFWRVMSKQQCGVEGQKKFGEPVILMHGLLDHSFSWFVNADRDKSLPYMLAAKGFDVWIGNNRGNRASQKRSDHINEEEYWSFTFDHLVYYDFPTIVDSVLKETGYQQVTYVGHSQGGCQLLTGLGVRPQMQPKIKKFIGLGTLIGISNLTEHETVNFLINTKFLQIMQFIGFKMVYSIPRWMSIGIGLLLHNSELMANMGHQFILFLCGYPEQRKIDLDYFPTIAAHSPGGASINNVRHLIQFVERKRMAKFDYGPEMNMKIYKSEEPPVYRYNHLGNLPFHSYLFQGDKDKMITELDFRILVKALHEQKVEVHMVPDYGHLDYMWSKDAYKDIYEKVVEILMRDGD